MSRQRDENRAISRELLIKSKPCIARQIANQFWSGCLLISAKHVTIYLLTWALVWGVVMLTFGFKSII